MSIHLIPLGIDLVVLNLECSRRIPGKRFIYDVYNEPTQVEFFPDLTQQEEILFLEILEHVASNISLKNLPNWSSWTANEAEAYVNDNILSGQTQAQIDAWIDTNVTTLASARTALKLLAGGIISSRTIMSQMARAIIFIKNILIGM